MWKIMLWNDEQGAWRDVVGLYESQEQAIYYARRRFDPDGARFQWKTHKEREQ